MNIISYFQMKGLFKIKTIDLKDKSFWNDIRVMNGTNFDSYVEEFYKLYKTQIKEYMPSADDNLILTNLKFRILQDNYFLLIIYGSYVETKDKSGNSMIIANQNFNLDNIDLFANRIYRLLRKRIRESEKPYKNGYIKPETYPFVYKIDKNQCIIFIKKYVGKKEKPSKKRTFYNGYADKIIRINNYKGIWKIRNNFTTQAEKGIIKNILDAKKRSTYREFSLEEFYNSLKKSTEILSIKGDGDFDKGFFEYTIRSTKNTLNELLQDKGFNIILPPNNISKIDTVTFEINKTKIPIKIFQTDFNIFHIKLIPTGFREYQIAGIDKLLIDSLNIMSDTYIYTEWSVEDKIKYVLSNKVIEEPYSQILSQEINALSKSPKIITARFEDKFRLCINKSCTNYQHSKILSSIDITCPDCNQNTILSSSKVFLEKNTVGISKWLSLNLPKYDLQYLGRISKYYKKTKISLLKFKTKEIEFFIYIHDKNILIDKLQGFFLEKMLPTIMILTKDESIDLSEMINETIGVIRFSELYLDIELRKKTTLITDCTTKIIPKMDSLKTVVFSDALNLLKKFVTNYDLEIIEKNTSIQSKGKAFEKLVNNIFRRICTGWIELGQAYQNKSYPDGAGILNDYSDRLVFGFDAKLKKSSRNGLSDKEIEKQIKYISDFKNEMKHYGKLGSWIIVIKSKNDYGAYKKSVVKIKKGACFKNICLLSIEYLVEISEHFNKKVLGNDLEKTSFYLFFNTVLRNKGAVDDVVFTNCKKLLEKKEPFELSEQQH